MAVKRVKNPGKTQGAKKVGELDPCWAKGFQMELPSFEALPDFPNPRLKKKFLKSYSKMLKAQARQIHQLAREIDVSPDKE